MLILYRRASVASLLALCLFVFLGCDRGSQTPATQPSSTTPTSAPAAAKTINVAAAADLRFTMDALVAGFSAQHSEVIVKTTFGSSGNLTAQISNKAPFDVFMSADAGYPDKLISQKDALADTRFVYAMGTLVLWIPNKADVKSESAGLEILKSESFHKIAIANPKLAPYGRAAEAALKKEGLWDVVKDRLVLGENIAQTAQFLTTGAADAGLVSQSLTVAEPLKSTGRVIAIPESDYPPIEQVAVVVATSPEPDAAKAFCAFVASDAGRAILESHGLHPPKR
jgi:molybdate transport system substrate-binding protein